MTKESISSLKKSFLKPNSVFRRTFFCIFCILLILMLVFQAVLYSTMNRNLKRNVHNSNESVVSLAASLSNAQFSILLNQAQTLSRNETVMETIIFPERPSARRNFNMIEALRSFVSETDYVSKVALLARFNESIYTSSGQTCTMADYKNPSDFSSREIGQMTDSCRLLQTQKGVFCLRYDFILGSRGYLGTLLIYLDNNALFSHICGENKNLNVYTASGDLLFTKNNTDRTEHLSSMESDALSSQDVIIRRSEETGLQFCQTYPQVYLSIREFISSGTAPLLSIIMLPVLFLLALFAAWVFYKPLHTLVGTLPEFSETQSDDWSCLNSAFHELSATSTQLQSLISTAAPFLQRELLIHIIEGEKISEESLAQTLSRIPDALPKSGTFVLYVTRDRDSGVLNAANAQSTINRLQNLAHPGCQFFSFEYRYSILTVACLSQTEQGNVPRTLDDLQHAISVYAGNLSNCVIHHSAPIQSIFELNTAYIQAVSQSPKSLDQSSDRAALEDRIRRSVSIAAEQSEDAGVIIVDNLISAVQMASLTPHDAFCCYRTLLDSINELARAYHVNIRTSEEFLSTIDGTRISALTQEYAHALLHEIFIKLDNRQHKYFIEAKSYMEKHYMDQDLSLNTIAEQIGISTSYLSRIFTTAYNMRFTQKLNDLRIEKSKELLSDQTKLVRDISEEVGFLTVQNFMRVFKQRTGITPSEYRMAIQHQASEDGSQ